MVAGCWNCKNEQAMKAMCHFPLRLLGPARFRLCFSSWRLQALQVFASFALLGRVRSIATLSLAMGALQSA